MMSQAEKGNAFRAHEMRNQGTFGFAADAANPRDVDETFPN
jgi:hypothetical protein